MKLKVLGTQSPYNTQGHNCPGFLITDGNRKLMLDCGSGSHSLLDFPQDLENLNIILTHLHRDHYNDIFNLQYASFVFRNQKRISNPIKIYMPLTPDRIRGDIMGEKNAFAEYRIISNGSHIKIGDMDVSFCPTNHPYETYAVKVISNGKIIVYTSDTSFWTKKKLVDFAKEADLLICESSLLEEYGFSEINSHLTAKQAGIIANEAGVKCLMLTHFWPEEEPEKYVQEAKKVFACTIAAREGMTIDLSMNNVFWEV